MWIVAKLLRSPNRDLHSALFSSSVWLQRKHVPSVAVSSFSRFNRDKAGILVLFLPSCHHITMMNRSDNLHMLHSKQNDPMFASWFSFHGEPSPCLCQTFLDPNTSSYRGRRPDTHDTTSSIHLIKSDQKANYIPAGWKFTLCTDRDCPHSRLKDSCSTQCYENSALIMDNDVRKINLSERSIIMFWRFCRRSNNA